MPKINLSLLVSTLIIVSSYLTAQNVHIPDANFKSYLINNSFINLNSDDEIQIEEANNYEGHIDCSNKSISNLEGINAFKKIYYLNCSSNELTSLNVSSNTKLIILICDTNQIETLDLSNCNDLVVLDFGHNKIDSIDLSKNSRLGTIECQNNLLKHLDISKNLVLNVLKCDQNLLTQLDVSANVQLTSLTCSENQLTNLDITNNVKLDLVDFTDNQLSNLDISQNLELKSLFCSENNLSALDLTKHLKLSMLSCHTNQLTVLDVSYNTDLDFLDCAHNQLVILTAHNGNNNNWKVFLCNDNPELTCIQVSDPEFMNSTILEFIIKDETAQYSKNCLLIDGTYGLSDHLSLQVFPNPSNGTFYIESQLVGVSYDVLDVNGSIVHSGIINSESEQFALGNFTNGFYVLQIGETKVKLSLLR